jgi:hypothetical protein
MKSKRHGDEAEVHPFTVAFAREFGLLLDNLPEQPVSVPNAFVSR